MLNILFMLPIIHFLYSYTGLWGGFSFLLGLACGVCDTTLTSVINKFKTKMVKEDYISPISVVGEEQVVEENSTGQDNTAENNQSTPASSFCPSKGSYKNKYLKMNIGYSSPLYHDLSLYSNEHFNPLTS